MDLNTKRYSAGDLLVFIVFIVFVMWGIVSGTPADDPRAYYP